MKKGACVGIWADAFRAAADFIAGDFAAAVIRFGQLAVPGADVQCLLEFPAGRSTVLTYLAASRMKLDPQDAEAARLLAAADADSRALRDRGFDTPPHGIADAAVRWYRGDGGGAGGYGCARLAHLRADALLAAVRTSCWRAVPRGCQRPSATLSSRSSETASGSARRSWAFNYGGFRAAGSNCRFPATRTPQRCCDTAKYRTANIGIFRIRRFCIT